MYRKLLQRWKSDLTSENYQILRQFSREMDRNSLWLGYVETAGEVTTAYFTDDADWYGFTLEDMNQLLKARSQGRSFNWSEIEADHRLSGDPDFEGDPGMVPETDFP